MLKIMSKLINSSIFKYRGIRYFYMYYFYELIYDTFYTNKRQKEKITKKILNLTQLTLFNNYLQTSIVYLVFSIIRNVPPDSRKLIFNGNILLYCET